MAILNLLKKEQKSSNILTFKKHPYAEFGLESKIHYLNGLALVMNEDDNIHEQEKEYLTILINTFNIVPEQLEDIIEFAKKPEEEMILEMFNHFNTNEMKYLFLLDSMMIAHSDGDFSETETDLIKQYILMLNLNEDLYNEIKNISSAIVNKDADLLKKLIDTSNNIKINLVQHFIDFYKIDYMEFSNKYNKISSENDYQIVIDRNGKLKSIGRNNHGCLGIGNEENRFEEFQNVIGLPEDSKCLSISSTSSHSLALFDNNDIYAWGNNYYGQLGNNVMKEVSLFPFKVIGLPKNIKPIKIISVNDSSFILFENNVIYASGLMVNSLVFIELKLNFKILDFIIADYKHAIISIDENNILKIFRIDNEEDNIYYNILEYQGLPNNIKIKQIIANNRYLFVLLENGDVYALKQNYSTLKKSNNQFEKSFSKIDNINNTKQLTAHKNRLLALTESGIYELIENEEIMKLSSAEKIEELSIYLKDNEKFEISCSDSCFNYNRYYSLYNLTTSKLYALSIEDEYPYKKETIIYNFSK